VTASAEERALAKHTKLKVSWVPVVYISGAQSESEQPCPTPY
jgi:hypothetical protein